MPTYEFECQECLSRWEAILKVADRKDPETKPCPFCEKSNSVRQNTFTAPSLGDPVRLGFVRPNSDVREVLQRAQEKSPKSEIKDYSTLTRL